MVAVSALALHQKRPRHLHCLQLLRFSSKISRDSNLVVPRSRQHCLIPETIWEPWVDNSSNISYSWQGMGRAQTHWIVYQVLWGQVPGVLTIPQAWGMWLVPPKTNVRPSCQTLLYYRREFKLMAIWISDTLLYHFVTQSCSTTN